MPELTYLTLEEALRGVGRSRCYAAIRTEISVVAWMKVSRVWRKWRAALDGLKQCCAALSRDIVKIPGAG